MFILSPVDIWLQTFVEVVGAYAGIDDGRNEQDNGENSEGGQLLPRRSVGLLPSRRVNAVEFEAEIAQAADVKYLRERGQQWAQDR